MKVVGFDQRIERGAHEPALPRLIQPNVLVAGERGAKIDLRDGIEPTRLEKWPRSSVAGCHHQLNQRTNFCCRIPNLWRTSEAATRVRADEIIDHIEGQVCTGQGLVRKIHALLKGELKNLSCEQGILGESDPRRESISGLVEGLERTTVQPSR